MQSYKWHCEILSPIHIGTGDQLEPLDYIIRDERFYRFDLLEALASLPPERQDELGGWIDKGDLVKVRSFLSENIDLKRFSLYTADVSKEVQRIYQSRLHSVENQLLVNPLLRSPLNRHPLIPGSSLKGAVRTALLSEMANEKKLPKPQGNEIYEFEGKVLDCLNEKGRHDVSHDPFRILKISDAELPISTTEVAEVKNLRRRQVQPIEPISIQMFTEATWSFLSGKPVTFETTVSVDDELVRKERTFDKGIGMEKLISACQNFYGHKIQRELEFTRGTTLAQTVEKLSQTSFDGNSFALRLGRFSGFESVTLDNYRQPPRGSGPGNTKNYFDGRFPMGWLKVTIVK